MQTVMPKTILLVEDEVLIAMNVQMTLQKYGFMVLMANNGEKAVESVEKNPQIDLILMDINLGIGIDGTEAARRILETHDIPLIFHSSHTEPEVVEKTEGITSYGYIVKNSGETVLIASIRMAFRLWESEGKFRTAFEHVAVGMVLTSVKGELLRVNEAFSSMLGYTPQEIFSMNFISLTHPDDKELSLGKMKLLLESESDRSTFTKRYIHKDSHTVWTNVRVVLLRDSSGKPLHFITHVEDITQRKEMEEALQRSIDQYDLLLKSIPVSIFIAQQGKYVYSNPYGARFLGYQTPEELVGVPIMDTIPESFQEVIRQRASRVEAGVGNEAMEMLLLRKDGNIIWSESTSIPFVYNNSQATMIIGRDITELRQTAIALAESKDRLESILKAVPTGIGVVLGTDRVLIDVNEKICAVFNEAEF